jgi:haloalkane dehalogenase
MYVLPGFECGSGSAWGVNNKLPRSKLQGIKRKKTFLAPFPTPESRRALLCWSRDIPIATSDPSYAEMQRIEQGLPQFRTIPVLLIWGMQDPVLPPAVLHQWQRLYPHATTQEIADASHFVHEDAPTQVLTAMEQFLDAHA